MVMSGRMSIGYLTLALLFTPGLTNYEVVNTKYGPVRGKVEQRGSAPIRIFRGIPFAAPPVKNLRFMPPVTVSPWKEVLNADRFAPVCPQDFPNISNTSESLTTLSQGRLNYLRRISPALVNQSEDCLYLNVYLPISGGEKTALPVVLFIHGDSYSWGSGNIYDGTALAAFGNIVVVTINYRLGVLGFLNANNGGSNGVASIPSNLGILDQIAALHWIQENIQDFDGDKNSVTVIGHGRGAACLHFLMTSDALPHGVLFHRVILMSGSALSPWAQASSHTNITRSLATSLSCPTASPHLIVECLRKTSLFSLLRHSQELNSRNRFATVFGPSYDGIVVHSFKNKVGEYLERMARYDMIIGVASAEDFIILNDEEMELGLETEGRNKLVSEFVTSTYSYHQKEIFSAILTEYTDWGSLNRHPVTTRDMTLEALTDGRYVSPAIETADYHASLNKNSWLYVFDYQTKYGDYMQRQGCLHGEELAYILGYPLLRSAHGNFTRAEAHLAEMTMTYWTNFITSGNPNFPHGTVEKKGRNSSLVDWNPYDPTNKKYLHIGGKLKIKEQFRARRVALWLNLIPDLLHSGQLERAGAMEEYLTYSETLPFIPSIKDISLMKDKSRPALLESQPSSSLSPLSPPAKIPVTPATAHNESIWDMNGSLSSYSTALSVTIAIGTSLLILNILIFAAVYYQRDRNKMGSRYSLSQATEPAAAPVNLTQPPGSAPPSVSGSVGMARTPQSRRQSCRLSYIGPNAHSAYLPPPQFADGQSSAGGSTSAALLVGESSSDSTFTLVGGGEGVGGRGGVGGGLSLTRRCHNQSISSDTQPLILGNSFRTLPRNMPGEQQHGGKHSSFSTTSSTSESAVQPPLGTQTLPLKSSLKKGSCPPPGPRMDSVGVVGSMEELRV